MREKSDESMVKDLSGSYDGRTGKGEIHMQL